MGGRVLKSGGVLGHAGCVGSLELLRYTEVVWWLLRWLASEGYVSVTVTEGVEVALLWRLLGVQWLAGAGVAAGGFRRRLVHLAGEELRDPSASTGPLTFCCC